MTLITENKYPYQSISRTADHVYDTPSGKLPSVTTILSTTKPEKDKKALDGWRKAVGKAKADAICNEAANRGTRMHNYLEGYVLNGEIKTPGVQIPIRSEVYKPILAELDKFGIHFNEVETPYLGYNPFNQGA